MYSLEYNILNNSILQVENLLQNGRQGVVLFFDGEIYNWDELSILYNLKPSKPDEEVLIDLYLLKGSKIFDELNGEFVIFILFKDKMLVARDHMGLKPCFYVIDNERICFSSDETQLVKATNIKPSREFIISHFKFSKNKLFISDRIKVVDPGNVFIFKSGEIEKVKYWFPEDIIENKKLTIQEVQKKYNSLLNNAVDVRITKNKNISAHLSGGLDSAYIVARLKEKLSEKFKIVYSQSSVNDFEKLQFDEKEFVNLIANKQNLSVYFADETRYSFQEISKEMPVYLVSFHEFEFLKHAKMNGIDVVFSGYGGDDFASINDRGISSDMFFSFKWTYFKNKYKSFRKSFKRVIKEVIFPSLRILTRSTKTSLFSNLNYLNIESSKQDKVFINENYHYLSRRDRHLKTLNSYTLTRNMEFLIQMGQRFDIQYKFPLLDKRVIEFMLSIPSQLLVADKCVRNRILMRNLLENYYPEKIVNRTSKVDPSVDKGAEIHFKPLIIGALKKITYYKQIKELNFINFDKLENDLSKLEYEKDKKNSIYELVLSLQLVDFFLKQFYEVSTK